MRLVLRIGLAVGAVWGLTGCQTAEQRMAKDDTQCLSYGVPKGSPAYVECRMRLEEQRTLRRAVNSTGAVGVLMNAAE